MAARTKLTLAEFLKLPETEPASEYVCGEVVQKPMPGRGHGFIQTFLAVVLFQFLARTGLGRVGTEVRCIFGPPGGQRAFVPDIAYIAREHLTPGDAAMLEAHHGAPDLAVEVLSPDQPAGEFADKLQFYLLHGVRMVWVINPMTRAVTVYEPGRDSVRLFSGGTLDGGDVLPGFSVSVDDIFAQMQV